jgi:hypothetical protein
MINSEANNNFLDNSNITFPYDKITNSYSIV